MGNAALVIDDDNITAVQLYSDFLALKLDMNEVNSRDSISSAIYTPTGELESLFQCYNKAASKQHLSGIPERFHSMHFLTPVRDGFEEWRTSLCQIHDVLGFDNADPMDFQDVVNAAARYACKRKNPTWPSLPLSLPKVATSREPVSKPLKLRMLFGALAPPQKPRIVE